MATGMKVVVIGDGSTYTPELMNGFLDRAGVFPLQALLANTLGPPASQVQVILDDLLEIHQVYLPHFWK